MRDFWANRAKAYGRAFPLNCDANFIGNVSEMEQKQTEMFTQIRRVI